VENTIVGIDVGTTKICTLIGQVTDGLMPRIIGVGVVPSRGIRRGMIVYVHDDTRVTLDDADTFTAFHVTAPGRTPAAVAVLLGSGAYADEDGNVWIPIVRLHELGRMHGGAEWRAGCDGMIAFAASTLSTPLGPSAGSSLSAAARSSRDGPTSEGRCFNCSSLAARMTVLPVMEYCLRMDVPTFPVTTSPA